MVWISWSSWNLKSPWSWTSSSSSSMSSSIRPPLPDDIIIQILCRLATKSVVRFRTVSWRWEQLTSTQYFARLHHIHGSTTPSIMVQESLSEKKEPFLMNDIDGWLLEGPNNMRNDPNSIKRICMNLTHSAEEQWWHYRNLLHSYDGLLLFNPTFCEGSGKKGKTPIIFNPATQEKATLYTWDGSKLGIFFHPIVKDYCVLWQRLTLKCVQFKMLIFGELRWRDLRDFSHQPGYSRAPVISNGALHWMASLKCFPKGNRSNWLVPSCSETIIAFDIKKEKFCVKPHPGVCNHSYDELHEEMQLVEIDGHVTLLCPGSNYLTSPLILVINVWKPENYARWRWNKRDSIVLDLGFLKSTSASLTALPELNEDVIIFGAHNGELLLHCCGKVLFAYNLCQRIIRKFEENGLNKDAHMFIHTHSLVSLKCFQSDMIMELQRDEGYSPCLGTQLPATIYFSIPFPKNALGLGPSIQVVRNGSSLPYVNMQPFLKLTFVSDD